mmetsp:Transcript_15938/g.38425  ORF Transcript_15938/g.38425 Transcript_15938/m.38425 type:complete len:302 (+) Transcript_15938:870-1775(+)
MMKRSVAIKNKVYDGEHIDLAESYNGIANIYKALGGSEDFDKALHYLRKTLKINTFFFGADHPSLAVVHHNIGTIFLMKLDLDNASGAFTKSVALRYAINPEDPELSEAYVGLGCTYYKKGESWYDEAMKSHQKALKLLCATGKSEHPSVGNAYEGMANVYFSQQKFDLAFDYYHKSIAVASNVFGSHHPNLAISMNNLANLYMKTGKLTQALEMYTQSLDVLKTNGCNHLDAASIAWNIAEVHELRADLQTAAVFYRECEETRSKVHGNDHEETADARMQAERCERGEVLHHLNPGFEIS